MKYYQVSEEDIEALERAALAADADGDPNHATALRRAALFNRRLKREQDAGIDSAVAVHYMDR